MNKLQIKIALTLFSFITLAFTVAMTIISQEVVINQYKLGNSKVHEFYENRDTNNPLNAILFILSSDNREHSETEGIENRILKSNVNN